MATGLAQEIRLPQWLAREKELPRVVMLEGVVSRTDKAALVRLRYTIRPSDRCHRCGLEITHPSSLAVGYGPECCEKLGLPRPDTVTAEEMLAAAGRLAEEEREVWVPLFVIGEAPPADDDDDSDGDDLSRLDLFVDTTFRERFARALPGYEPRVPQLQMARLVARGLEEGRHVIAEAGTGTGKSLAYLVPAIGHAVREGRRVLVSTGTIALQEQLVGKDIPFLQQHLGVQFRAALAKGKGNYLCKQRLDEEQAQPAFALDEAAQAILRWSKATETGDKSDLPFAPNGAWDMVCADDSCTGRKCGYYDTCFYYQAKRRLEEAHVVVCNHALFFADMKVRLASGGAAGVLPPAATVVFDEAHHLEQAAIGALGTEASNRRLGWLVRRIRKSEWFTGLEQADMRQVGQLLQQLEEENDRVFGLALSLKPDGEQAYRLPADALDRLETGRLLDGLGALWRLVEPAPGVDYGRLDEQQAKRRKLADLVEGLRADLVTILRGQEEAVSWAEVEERQGRDARVILHSTPISVAERLREHLFRNNATAVLASATISAGGRFDYLRQRIGLDDALEMVVASPFDYWDQCQLYVATHLPEPGERGWLEAAIPVIEQLLHASRGRAFVLCTSYRTMEEIHRALASRLPWRCLKQGEAPKGRLIEEFKRDVSSILFATASFWEGVDVQGEALSLVIIDKLPFSVPSDPVAQARAEAVEARGGSAFMELSVPEATIRFKQGFGRLIRSRADRGVVAVLDKRLITKRYGQTFLRSLPKVRVTDRLEDVKAFFAA